MNKLYVGNLPYSATEADLEKLFSEYGELTQITVITDRATGRSKGFGFVEFSDPAAAQAALAVDGQDWDGRNLKVSEAKEKTSGGGSRDRDRGGRGGWR